MPGNEINICISCVRNYFPQNNKQHALTYLKECHPLVAGVIAQISLYHQSPVEPVKLFVALFTPVNIQQYKSLAYKNINKLLKIFIKNIN